MRITDAETFDVLTPANLQEPFLLFAKLRREVPVYWSEQYLGGSLRYLLESRELWEQLRAAPEMIPSAVEELLRFVSPVLWVSRVAAEDIELNGEVLRKGQRLQLGIGAANHDPAEFDHPEELHFSRPKVNSLGFGYGAHFCVGAALARMEAQVALSTLLDRIPNAELATRQFEYRPLYFLRALKSLPIMIRR